MQAIEAEARALGCCRVTLEVRSDNERAQAVYARLGFRASEPQTWFWMKSLDGEK
jgi:ribosomal protein S18 acetylase RimI-like enzyme